MTQFWMINTSTCPAQVYSYKYHNITYNYSTVEFILGKKKNMEHSAQHTPSPPPQTKKKSSPNRPSSSTFVLPRCCPMSSTCGRASNSETVRTASLKWPQLQGPLGWPAGWLEPLKIGWAKTPKKNRILFAGAKKSSFLGRVSYWSCWSNNTQNGEDFTKLEKRMSWVQWMFMSFLHVPISARCKALWLGIWEVPSNLDNKASLEKSKGSGNQHIFLVYCITTDLNTRFFPCPICVHSRLRRNFQARWASRRFEKIPRFFPCKKRFMWIGGFGASCSFSPWSSYLYWHWM